MKIEWTVTYQTDFDLEQAAEDYNLLIKHPYNIDPDKAIYDAVEANWACDWYIEEFSDTSPAIEQCAEALRKRLGGVQMQMDLR